MESARTYTVFAGQRKLAAGSTPVILVKTKEYLDNDGRETVLIFEDWSGQQVEFDFHGTVDEVLQRASADEESKSEKPKVGRPKLGVISREVSLLPEQWEWLSRQPGSASGTLRRLIDTARVKGRADEQARVARDAAHAFMWTMGGNLPNFEEASRALYAMDPERLLKLIRKWPVDIRQHVTALVERAAELARCAKESKKKDEE